MTIEFDGNDEWMMFNKKMKQKLSKMNTFIFKNGNV
jgi:hypothetical protein